MQQILINQMWKRSEINLPPRPPPKSESQCLEANTRIHLLFLLAYIVVYFLIFFHPLITDDRKLSDIFNKPISRHCM